MKKNYNNSKSPKIHTNTQNHNTHIDWYRYYQIFNWSIIIVPRICTHTNKTKQITREINVSTLNVFIFNSITIFNCQIQCNRDASSIFPSAIQPADPTSRRFWIIWKQQWSNLLTTVFCCIIFVYHGGNVRIELIYFLVWKLLFLLILFWFLKLFCIIQFQQQKYWI